MGLFGKKKTLEERMSKSAPKPAPKAKTDEELYTEGARAYTEKNYAEAVQIWRQLAEKGMARAQVVLAQLYYHGNGVEKDEKKSAEWYRKAAEQGHGNSCFNLAILYERGIGVTKDLNEALSWAEKAKAAGVEKADNLIAEIRHNIEAEENRKNLTKPSAPKPGDDLSPEEKYRKGMELFRAGDYDGAYALLRRVCRAWTRISNDYPDGFAAMGWMYEHGCGVEEAQDDRAHLHYKIAAQNGDRNGMAGFVRLTAKATSPSLKDCEVALNYVKQLGTSEAKSAVPSLEQKLAEAQLREKYAELDLNEDNVKAIFNRCGKENDDGSTAWNEEALKQNKANIFYLLGQLALVHKGVKEHELDSAFIKKYDGNTWLHSASPLIPLLNMGGSSGFCSFFKQDDKQFVELHLYTLKRTVSPKDPYFPVWWESAEGLTVRAEIAKMTGNLTDALSRYEKAAKLGDADAQYKVGTMYESGTGTERDLSQAIEWYQKASNQGHEAAKASLKECQTEVKAMQGDAEAQYAYAERLGWSDKAKAFAFYLKAAKQGHRDAQYKTGYCYALGKGTEKDSREALKWLQAAAKQGHKNAGILSGLMGKKDLFGGKAADLEAELSKLIDRYETISDSEKDLLIGIYADLSDDMKDKFNHAQAKSLKKLADRM